MVFHTGFASALYVSGFHPFISRMATGSVNLVATSSLFAVVWVAYLADRLASHPEDDAPDGAHSSRTVRQSPLLFWSLLMALGCLELVLAIRAPWLVGPIAIALAVSMLYSARVPLLGRRVKTIPYFKSFYLAFASVVTVVAFTPVIAHHASTRTVTLLVLCMLLYFLNYSLFDIKDVEGDRRANIKTLALALGVDGLLKAHLVIAVLAAVAAVAWLGPRSGWPLSAVAIFHALVCLRLFRRPLTPTLCALVDLGYGVLLGAGALLAA